MSHTNRRRAPWRRARLASAAGGVLGLALVIWCFTGYLTPAALLSLLTGSAFCG